LLFSQGSFHFAFRFFNLLLFFCKRLFSLFQKQLPFVKCHTLFVKIFFFLNLTIFLFLCFYPPFTQLIFCLLTKVMIFFFRFMQCFLFRRFSISVCFI